MLFIIRHLSPLVRSRRRFSFSLLISVLISIVFILYLIDYNRQSLDLLLDQELIQTTNKNSLLNVFIPKTTTTTVIEKNGLWAVDEKGRSLKKHFLALDLTGFFGAGNGEGATVQCISSNTTFIWTRQQNRIDAVDFVISHDAPVITGTPFNLLKLNQEKQQYSMAFIMESEVHSSTGDTWAKYNFKMSYNLDDSYPEPATYFDTNTHIIDLLKPPSIPFEEKDQNADIVWIISNCNAQNARQDFIRQLMKEIKIDSYGSCLNNRQGYAARMTDNIYAYKKYKFVIAIENSNCVDYVTEKLVKAVESGSVPIVAGRSGRPDYRRYMPDHSYINIFDYTSIKALADDLKRIATNKTLYESYLWFKKHDKNITQLSTLSLDEKLKKFADVIGSNATMITNGIAGKEKSEDKVCKLIRFVRQTPWQEIAAHNGTARVNSDIACLPVGSIITYFNSLSSNSSQAA
ncbi:unnamed protein product [Rotaria magnacalcarata]|uniref:Fucosyltransferase n=1 Tax=Rotaria magnacalcarata TaxID=392030 RepID=A0A816UAF6_9BILA|nr:unnamed protein product [Rotaria magnacalcarata]